jgi:hypothetical protein
MSHLWGIGVLGLDELGVETLELRDAGPKTTNLVNGTRQPRDTANVTCIFGMCLTTRVYNKVAAPAHGHAPP